MNQHYFHDFTNSPTCDFPGNSMKMDEYPIRRI